MSQAVPVLASPLFDPDARRIDVELPAGLTIRQMIDLTLPGLPEPDQVRVVLVTEQSSWVIEPRYFEVVRPRAGIRVVIRVIPGKNVLRSVLQVVVSLAAVAIGNLLAPAVSSLFGISTNLAASLIGLGVTVLGGLLINALVPPQKPKGPNNQKKTTSSYDISGWKNRMDPNGVIPELHGKMRYAPPFATAPYTEVVGDKQFINAVFNFGEGGDAGLVFSDFQIGDTSVDDYDNVQIETRPGFPTDSPLSVANRHVIEEPINAELTRPRPRDYAGNIQGGAGISTPVVRFTGSDAIGASVILGFPAGVGRVDDSGNTRSLNVQIRIRYQEIGTNWWTEAATLNVTAGKFEGFYRQFNFGFDHAGSYKIEVERLRDEDVDAQVQSRSVWVGLQTIRNGYPMNYGRPLALVAVRVQATYQLNGQLDNFNALVSRPTYDWNGSNWIIRETSNPASCYMRALMSPANPKRVGFAEIDLDALADWHDFCRVKGLKYDRVLEEETKLDDILTEIAAAGRAFPRHDGIKYTIVIDRPQTLVVDHVNQRNAWQIKATRNYYTPPDGFRVSFLDATNDYKAAERLIPWPGHSGRIELWEKLEMPGKTDPAEIWREARRRMYEALYRADTYSALQNGAIRTATRGDLVVLNTDMLEHAQVSARVKSVAGRFVELDDRITMIAGRSYVLRFRTVQANDTVGQSVLRNVVFREGEHSTLTLDGAGPVPAIDDIVQFGPILSESIPVVVSRVEPGKDFTTYLTMLDAAPIIDELTDQERPPAWNGNIGEEISGSTNMPPSPIFVGVRSGIKGTGNPGGLLIMLQAGASSIATSTFRLQHRLNGSTTWTTVDFPAVNGGIELSTYSSGDPVQVRAAGISPDRVVGDYGAPLNLTIGSDDDAVPRGLDGSMVSIGALLGGAAVMFSTSDDVATTRVQLYRSTVNALNRSTDRSGSPVTVQPSRSYTISSGDTTRENLLSNGAFSSDSNWNLGPDWEITGGKALHDAGTVDSALTQIVTLVGGRTYRIAFTVGDTTDGSIKPRLWGAIDNEGTPRTFNGQYSDRLQLSPGNSKFSFVASASFAGSIDDAVLFLETDSCLAAGIHYFWIEPQNDYGVAGPISGPYQVRIR